MKKLLVMACSVFTLLSQAQSLKDSLIICMPMDNNANDFSGYNNHGSLVGGVSSTSGHTGFPNTAYHFNGTTGYIKIPTSSSIDRTEQLSEISVSIWCNITAWSVATPASKIFPIMERFDATTNNGWSYNLLDPISNGYDVLFYSDGLYGTPSYLYNIGAALGTWKHHVMVYSKSGDFCKYYVDGVLIQTFTTLTAPASLFNTHHGEIRIGFSEEGINEYGNGDVDDLRVYDRALTDAEVQLLFSDKNLTCESDPDVNGGGGKDCCLGNLCRDSKNALKGDYEIPMNNHNFNYTMPKNSPSEVLIGYTGCKTGSARLDVTDDQIGTAVKGYCSTSSKDNIGVYGIGGTVRDGETGTASYGVLGEATSLKGSGYSVGVGGFGGGPALLSAPPAGQSIGVYGNSKVNNAMWAGYFDGDVTINGIGYITSGSWSSSDKRYKNNIKALESVTEKIQKLSGYTYTFKTDEFKAKNFDSRSHIGFIAQELKEVFPELVKEDSKGFLAVNYEGMIPVLLQAVKEQAAQNQTQQQQINELKTMVAALAGKTTDDNKVGGTIIPVTLSDKNVVVLNQNVPNPFAESTVISYNIPSDFTKAQVIFTNESGTVIKAIDIKEKGQGTLNVFANDLSHGMYSYTLIIDGKKMDTKKMIKD